MLLLYLRAEIIDISSIKSDKVKFGATVLLENIDNNSKIKYQIVSEFEANIEESLISINSPVARALITKEVGDEVEIRTPGGIVNYEILKIDYL